MKGVSFSDVDEDEGVVEAVGAVVEVEEVDEEVVKPVVDVGVVDDEGVVDVACARARAGTAEHF